MGAKTNRGAGEGIRKILFIQTAFLGDVVFSTALLQGVASIFPGAEVTFLASPRGGGILEDDPIVHEVLLYDKRGRDRGLRALWRLIGQVRMRRFDLVVSPHRSFRSAVVARFSGASRRLGFRSGWGRWAYNCGIPFPRGELVPFRRELALVQGLGHTSAPFRPRIDTSVRRREEMRRMLREEGVGEDEKLIGLAIGTVWPTKRWPVERFVELGRRLHDSGAGRVVVIGSADEGREAQAFRAVEGAVNLTGRTNLHQLPALLSLCRVVVAGDTGPLHASMAMGIPVVALFGPTDERQFDFGAGDECLKAALSCRPCRPHGSRTCPEGDWECMIDISVDDVERAVGRALEGEKASAG